MNVKDKVIIKNSLYLLSRTLLLSIISLYTVREVLHVLGAEGYGLFNLIFGVVTLFAFVNGALMASTQRYLGYKLGQKDIVGLKDVFFTSCMIHFILACTLGIVLFIFKDIIINKVLSVGLFKKEAEFLYLLAITNVFITVMQSPFSAIITIYEKMKVFAYLAILEGTSKLLVVYALYIVDYNKIILYGVLLVTVSLMILMLHIIYSYRSFPQVCSIKNTKDIQLKLHLKDMLGFMGWSLIGNLAYVAKKQGVNVILNMFFGIVVNAAYALSMTITTLVSNLVSSVSNAIKPQLFKSYAEKNMSNFYSLLSNGTKYYIYALIIILLPLMLCLNELLHFWLVDVPVYAVLFCKLALLIVFIEAYSTLLIVAVQATGNIRNNQIILGSLLLLNLPIGFAFLHFGYAAYSVFYVSLVLSLVILMVRLFIVQALTGYKVSFFIRDVLIPTLKCVFVAGLAAFFYRYLIYSWSVSFFTVFSLMCLIGITSLLCIYLVGLNSIEKEKIRLMISKFR